MGPSWGRLLFESTGAPEEGEVRAIVEGILEHEGEVLRTGDVLLVGSRPFVLRSKTPPGSLLRIDRGTAIEVRFRSPSDPRPVYDLGILVDSSFQGWGRASRTFFVRRVESVRYFLSLSGEFVRRVFVGAFSHDPIFLPSGSPTFLSPGEVEWEPLLSLTVGGRRNLERAIEGGLDALGSLDDLEDRRALLLLTGGDLPRNTSLGKRASRLGVELYAVVEGSASNLKKEVEDSGGVLSWGTLRPIFEALAKKAEVDVRWNEPPTSSQVQFDLVLRFEPSRLLRWRWKG